MHKTAQLLGAYEDNCTSRGKEVQGDKGKKEKEVLESGSVKECFASTEKTHGLETIETRCRITICSKVCLDYVLNSKTYITRNSGL